MLNTEIRNQYIVNVSEIRSETIILVEGHLY